VWSLIWVLTLLSSSGVKGMVIVVAWAGVGGVIGGEGVRYRTVKLDGGEEAGVEGSSQ